MLVIVDFDPGRYGTEVQRLLALDGSGQRAMPLVSAGCSSAGIREELKRAEARKLFPAARFPEAALAGLFLYFSCGDDAHTIAQDLETPEGSFWHGILHRQEPDPGNAAYWFRRVGKHPIFPALRDRAIHLRFDTGPGWDPFAFIDFCESARIRPGSEEETIAARVQLAEWQLLFDHCAGKDTI